MPSSPKPLDSYSLLRSSDVEEVCAAVASVYARPTLVQVDCVETFEVRLNVCGLSDVDIGFGSFGSKIRFNFPPSGFFSQVFPVAGSGEIVCGRETAAVARGACALVPADCAQDAKFSADYEHLVLRISARALTAKLEAMTGEAINMPLCMRPLQNSTHPAAHLLQNYMPLFVELLSGPASPARCIAEAEDVLMTLFLCGHQHNYSHLIERRSPDAGPRLVRRAEEYIEANAQHAVTPDRVAEVLGVSVFALFRAFKTYRHYSPQEFLAQVRASRSVT